VTTRTDAPVADDSDAGGRGAVEGDGHAGARAVRTQPMPLGRDGDGARRASQQLRSGAARAHTAVEAGVTGADDEQISALGGGDGEQRAGGRRVRDRDAAHVGQIAQRLAVALERGGRGLTQRLAHADVRMRRRTLVERVRAHGHDAGARRACEVAGECHGVLRAKRVFYPDDNRGHCFLQTVPVV
jgi:hypothetical protein